MKVEKGIYTLRVCQCWNELFIEISREGESWDNFITSFDMNLNIEEVTNLRDYLNKFLEKQND